MSRHRSAEGTAASTASLTESLEHLRDARDLGAGRLPEDVLAGLAATLESARTRRSLSADHTVIGIFGATGSGKSSLVNALSGTDAARVAVRRPTTSEPLALVWGSEGSGELLDWLGVAQRVELPVGAPLLPARVPHQGPGAGYGGDPDHRSTSGGALEGAFRPGDESEPDAAAAVRWSHRQGSDGPPHRDAASAVRKLGRLFRRPKATPAADGSASPDAVTHTAHSPAPARGSGIVAGADSGADRTAGRGAVQPGLILLDLPDFDSTALAHREIVERFASKVDVLLWVLDPQKYADAALHHGFLRGLASHGSVTLVALNQVDRLPPEDLRTVMGSLRGILADEGLPGVGVVAVSARTGAGLEDLAGELRGLVESRAAASRRLAADVSRAASDVLPYTVAQPVRMPPQEVQQALTAQLGAAAGVPTVVDAVRSSYRRDAHAVAGWPGSRWLARLRPDPLRRLNLRRQDVLPEHRASSLALRLPAQGAKVDQALRVFADATADDAVEPWRSSLRDAARSTAPQVADALDSAVTGTDLETGRRAWWGFFGVLQWIAFAALAGGLLWLGVLAVLGFLQLPAITVPRVEGFPVPTLLILGGVAAGILLAVIAALLARVGAARRAARVRRRLLEACSRVASDVVLTPVEAEVTRCNDFRAAVLSALPRA